jgi:hypothetical protein
MLRMAISLPIAPTCAVFAERPSGETWFVCPLRSQKPALRCIRRTTVKDEAMDRLKLWVLLPAAVIAAGLNCHQLWAQSAGPRPSSCLVIGDVERPDAYPVGSSVSQLVNAAGLSSASANVSVIRLTRAPTQWSEFVQRDSVTDGAPVGPGDILIVRSASPVDRATTASAALTSKTGTFVVTLGNGGITVGDVLAQCQVSLSTGTTLLKFSAAGSKRGTAVSLSALVNHSDVIVVSTPAVRLARGQRSMLPRVSESALARQSNRPSQSSSGVRTVSRELETSFEPQTAVLLNHLESNPIAAVPMGVPMEVPPTDDGRNDNGERVGFLTLPVPIEVGRGNDPFVLGSADSAIPASNPDVFHQTGSEVQFETAAVELTELDQLEITAPIPPDEPVITAGGFGLLNTLFVSGLLLAGSLIIAGWVRSELAQSKRDAVALAGGLQVVCDKERLNSRRHDIVQRASDPQINTVSNATPQTIPNLHNPQMSPAQSLFAATVVNRARRSPISQPAAGRPPLNSDSKPLAGDREFFGSWNNNSTHLPESAVETASSGNRAPHQTSAIPTTNHEAANAADASSNEALEDLIHNRLPVDLCPAKLPLRVALFGRPAGPRRLRIDNEHHGVPAPHGPVRQHLSQGAQSETPTDQTTSDTRDQNSSGSDLSLNSLDSALQYLNGRVNS